jgi:hypothetical protein
VVVVAGSIATVATSAVKPARAWTTSKAELMLLRDASIQLPAPERRALEVELRQAAMGYSAARARGRGNGRLPTLLRL